MKITHRIKQFSLLPQVIKWILIASVVGFLAGTASAIFLYSLHWATDWRESHVWIIALLPVAGFVIGWVYHHYGKAIEDGNNLLIDEIHEPQTIMLFRMAPLIMISTVVTHLFGGSAGREGTAIQMGGALADRLTKPLGLDAEDRRILLMAGISAGFASVFGTPLAGAVFGLEVLAIGKLRYDAIMPCFIAAIIGDKVTLACGIHHVSYAVPFVPDVTWSTLAQAVAAGAIFGMAGMCFAKTTHAIGTFFKENISYGPWRPALGGVVVAAGVWALHSTRYIGLGISTISESFTGTARPWDFLGKLLFTAVTLGSGFKGGEVTPLFFIGSTLGNALAYVFRLPAPVLAGMGFVAVFAGAANTPLSSTFLAIEFFGAPMGIYAGVACVLSYLFSGHAGIYHAQRLGLRKNPMTPAEFEPGIDVFEDVHFTGFLIREEKEMMKNLAVLRFYFHYGTQLKAKTFWKKWTAPTLNAYLMTEAKVLGITQAITYRVPSGYLNGEAIQHDLSDIPPAKLPLCVEFLDEEGKLRRFVEAHKTVLAEVRTILLRVESPLVDNVLDDSFQENQDILIAEKEII